MDGQRGMVEKRYWEAVEDGGSKPGPAPKVPLGAAVTKMGPLKKILGFKSPTYYGLDLKQLRSSSGPAAP